MGMKRVSRLGIISLFAFFGAGLAAAGSQVQEYLPLAEGREWSYQITKIRKYVTPERAMTQRLIGTSDERCEKSQGVLNLNVPVFLLLQKVNETNETTGRTSASTIRSYLSSEPDQVLLHAQNIEGAPLPAELEKFVPPVAVLKLPIPGPGEAYPSIMKSQGFTLDSRPYESAVESVETPAGNFKDCLRIKSRGPLSGKLPGPQPLTVSDGSLEETSWFAKGVGVVKQIQVLRMTIELPNGQKMETTEEKTKVLASFKGL